MDYRIICQGDMSAALLFLTLPHGIESYPFRMTFGFYYRAHRARLQQIVLPVGADGGRACTDYPAYLVS
jgi:hypothetical protein